MEDIAPGLLERVREKFEADARADARVKAFLRKVEKGTATQDDCGAYADRLGKLLSDAMAAVVTPEALPNGILYQNIAEKLLTPTLRDVYERVNENAARVQKKEDEARHIGMNAAKPAFPEARVRDLTYVIGRPDNAPEQALSFLREPVRTISRSFHDDFIEENARQRWYAGMDPIVSREASAGCCEWCAALAGNWDYGDAEHLGVFRRHQFCRCSVTYSCDGRAQDVWSKKYYEADPETIKERAEYGRELIRSGENHETERSGQDKRPLQSGENRGKINENEEYIVAAKDEEDTTQPKGIARDYRDFQPLELTDERLRDLQNIRDLAEKESKEQGFAVCKGERTELQSSKEHSTIDICFPKGSEHVEIYHAHPDDSVLSRIDMKSSTNPNVDIECVVCRNGDIWVLDYTGGIRPDEDEYGRVINIIENEAQNDLLNDPSYPEWTYEERYYMLGREIMYRTANYFEWKAMGGNIDGKSV